MARVVANGGAIDRTRVDTSAYWRTSERPQEGAGPDKHGRGGDEPRRANALPRTRIRSASARRFLLRRPPQLQQDVVDARPAFVAIFLEAGTYQPVKGWRAQGLRSGDWRRLGREDCRDQARLALPGEGLRRRDQLVKDGPKGEDVGSCVNFLPLELLGRHVLQSADDESRFRVAAGECCSRVAADCGPQTCQPEIQQLGTVRSDHHVGRLQVAMHDALCVRSVQGFRNFDTDA